MNGLVKLWRSVRWRKKRKRFGYQFLDGDPAYDFLKTKQLPKAFILLGARIDTAKFKTSHNPHSIIEMGYLHVGEKMVQPVRYSYKKTLREVKKQSRYGA